jgi:hypothetical protein
MNNLESWCNPRGRLSASQGRQLLVTRMEGLTNAGKTDGNTASETEILRKERLMPTELVVIGGILVAAAGGLCFLFLHHLKAAEPPHIR